MEMQVSFISQELAFSFQYFYFDALRCFDGCYARLKVNGPLGKPKLLIPFLKHKKIFPQQPSQATVHELRQILVGGTPGET